jgi:hypothetical protein
MHHRLFSTHRLPVAALAVALALTACGSDDGGSTTETSTTPSTDRVTTSVTDPATDGSVDTNDTGDTTGVLTLADTAPDGADIAIEAAVVTADRSIRRGGQSAIEQGQTFAVEADTTLASVSFLVAAPGGVAAGTPVQLAVYEVSNTVTMAPSGFVDLGSGTNELVVALPGAIEPDTPTHLVFSLPDVAVTPGQYAVVLSFAHSAPPAEMFLQHPDGDVYANGVAISLEGEFWKSNTNDEDSAVTISFGG